MQSAVEPRLMEVFLAFGKLESLDRRSKAALQLCNKQIKAAIDATVNSASVDVADLIQFPDSIGKMNALKVVRINKCDKLTTIPEFFGGLLRRTAQGEGAALERVSLAGCEKLKLAPEIKEALEPLKELKIYSEHRDYYVSDQIHDWGEVAYFPFFI
jgi:ABC-type proline/glycine betaine transport system ATPase subunit